MITSGQPRPKARPGTRRVMGAWRCAWAAAMLALGAQAPAQTAPAPAPAPAPTTGTARAAPEDLDAVREFTNAQGQKIKAQITNYRTGEVYLKREDGQTFRSPVTLFSAADQEFIRRWALREAAKRGDLFDITASPFTGNSTTSRTESTTTVTWQAQYKLKLQNRSQLEFANLRVDYIVFKLNAAIAATRSNDGAVTRTQASTRVAALKPGATFEFESVKVDMDKQSLNPGWSYSTPGARNSASDDLLGIWVRIYAGTDLLQEWCSSVELMRKEKW